MASQFPDDFPTYDPFTTPITLAAFQHTARHRQMQEDIVALSTKLGKDDDTNPHSIDYMIRHIDLSEKISYSETSTEDMEFVLDEDDFDSDSDTKLATQASIKAYVDSAIAASNENQRPVGTLYINADDDTNPATLLGFGEWELYATGRVLVGVDTGEPVFDTPGETGGFMSTRHGYIETPMNSSNFQDPGAAYITSATSDMDAWLTGGGSSSVSRSATVRSVGGTIRTTGTSGTEVRHARYTAPNLQPYVTVYIFRRTA